ncbi:hypothetical protein ACLOJK_013807 [Asimina triloba]
MVKQKEQQGEEYQVERPRAFLAFLAVTTLRHWLTNAKETNGYRLCMRIAIPFPQRRKDGWLLPASPVDAMGEDQECWHEEGRPIVDYVICVDIQTNSCRDKAYNYKIMMMAPGTKISDTWLPWQVRELEYAKVAYDRLPTMYEKFCKKVKDICDQLAKIGVKMDNNTRIAVISKNLRTKFDFVIVYIQYNKSKLEEASFGKQQEINTLDLYTVRPNEA